MWNTVVCVQCCQCCVQCCHGNLLHPQVFLSIIFLYITFVAPAVAFGGLMEEVTGNLIGETETLILTGMAGMFFGLTAVQPIAILAFTGPLLLYEALIFSVSLLFCVSCDALFAITLSLSLSLSVLPAVPHSLPGVEGYHCSVALPHSGSLCSL